MAFFSSFACKYREVYITARQHTVDVAYIPYRFLLPERKTTLADRVSFLSTQSTTLLPPLQNSAPESVIENWWPFSSQSSFILCTFVCSLGIFLRRKILANEPAQRERGEEEVKIASGPDTPKVLKTHLSSGRRSQTLCCVVFLLSVFHFFFLFGFYHHTSLREKEVIDGFMRCLALAQQCSGGQRDETAIETSGPPDWRRLLVSGGDWWLLLPCGKGSREAAEVEGTCLLMIRYREHQPSGSGSKRWEWENALAMFGDEDNGTMRLVSCFFFVGFIVELRLALLSDILLRRLAQDGQDMILSVLSQISRSGL